MTIGTTYSSVSWLLALLTRELVDNGVFANTSSKRFSEPIKDAVNNDGEDERLGKK